MSKKVEEMEAGTTIVGGQPLKPRQRGRVRIPVGIEKVLCLAAIEPEFRDELLSKRLGAVEARGLELRDSEQAMLRAAPRAQLEAAIDGLDVSEGNLGRRSFMRHVAAAAVTLAAGEALSGCEIEGPSPDGGDTPDVNGHDLEIYDGSMGCDASYPPDATDLDVSELDSEAFPRDASTGIDGSYPPDVEVHDSVSGGARPDAPEDD